MSNASIFQLVCLMYPCPGSFGRPPATPQRAASPQMPAQAPPAASAVPRGRVGKPVVLSLWVFHGDYANPLLSFLGGYINKPYCLGLKGLKLSFLMMGFGV